MQKTIGILLIWSILFIQDINGQMFEGRIEYNMAFKDKAGAMSDAQSANLLGTAQIYQIKGNKYRSEMNGMLKATQIYKGTDTLFNVMEGVKAVLFVLATNLTDSVLSYSIKPSGEAIAGLPCELLELQTKEGMIQYWYNKSIRINPSDYQNHAYGFWNVLLKLTDGALPLQSITDNKKMRFEMRAVALSAEPVSDAVFLLPPGLPLVKSPE
jgi:hypothetical protein